MALKITQICDGCAKERLIRHVNDTVTHQWIEFYDNRFHMCPQCIQQALNEKASKDIHG